MIHENTSQEIKQLEAIHEQLDKYARTLGLAELKWVESKGTICFIPMLPPGDEDESDQSSERMGSTKQCSTSSSGATSQAGEDSGEGPN